MPKTALIWLSALCIFIASCSSHYRGATGGNVPAQVVTLTSSNRNYPGIMFGGWGPHLRASMCDSRDELWFVTDAGPDVQHDEQIRYHRFDGRHWENVATVQQIPGIQQNVASLMCDDVIYSYGISVRAPSVVEECIFDTRTQSLVSCASLKLGNERLLLPPSCNYVGAAVGPDGRKIVWWTTVGVNGGEGKWSYIYEGTNGWAGPIVSSLSGFNDFGYVFASFFRGGRLAIAGQLFKGAYPNGSYAVGCAEFAFGEKLDFGKNFFALDCSPENSGRSAADIFVWNGDTHVIAETQKGTLAYYYKGAADSWTGCDKPVCVLTNVHRARFIGTSREFCLVTGSANGDALDVRAISKSRKSGPVDWANIPPMTVPVPNRFFAQPAAIYVESPCYQTEPVKGLNFSVVGHYPEADSQIISFHLLR